MGSGPHSKRWWRFIHLGVECTQCMEEPSLETFRKWLQLEIIEAELMPESTDRNKRLIQLESALQESMAFEAAWELRAKAETQITQIETSVRLVSASPNQDNVELKTDACSSCGEPISAELEFCPSCGDFQ